MGSKRRQLYLSASAGVTRRVATSTGELLPHDAPEAHWHRIRTAAEAVVAAAVVTDAPIPLGFVERLHDGCRVLDLSDLPPPAAGDFEPTPRLASDTAFVQFSSGTTGTPKAILISNRAILAYLRATIQHIEFSASDVSVGWLPLNHDMGLLAQMLLPLLVGARSVLIEPAHWVRDPSVLLHSVSRHRGTMSWMPNFGFRHTLRRLADADLEGIDLRSWRIVGSGSEPVEHEALQAFADRFAPIGFRREALMVGYGMAEAIAGVTETPPSALFKTDVISTRVLHEERRAEPATPDAEETRIVVSCGTPKPGIELRIVDDARQPLPERHVGEVAIHSDTLFDGYYRRPDLTAEAMEDGQYYTGDLGYLADGELYICDRKKDLIIVGGQNVYPDHIEVIAREVLGKHGRKAAAFGIADKQTGTEIPIVVVEQRGLENPEEAAQAIRQRVLHELNVALADVCLVPGGWVVRTTSGKVAKSASRAKYLEAFGLPSFSAHTTEASTVSRIAAILQEVLGRLPLDTSYIDAGGDSVQAARIASRLRNRLGLDVRLSLFFDAPTMEELIQSIAREEVAT